MRRCVAVIQAERRLELLTGFRSVSVIEKSDESQRGVDLDQGAIQRERMRGVFLGLGEVARR